MYLFLYFVLFHESSWLNLANTLDFLLLFLLCFKKVEALKGSRNLLIYLTFFLVTHDLILLPPAACFWGWHSTSQSISPASSSVTPFLWMSSYVHLLVFCGHPLLLLPAPLFSTTLLLLHLHSFHSFPSLLLHLSPCLSHSCILCCLC